QDPPTINAVEVCGGDNIIVVTITAPALPAASFFRLEIFLNRVNRNPITEGEIFVGAIDSVPSGATVTQSFFVPSGVTTADFVSATATNLNNTGGTPGDTSEFTLNSPITLATPTVATLVGPTSPLCAGTSTDLTLTIVGQGPFDLTWSDGFVQTGVTSPVVRSVTPLETTVYSVIVANVFGCTESSNDVTVIVDPLPLVTLTSSSPTAAAGQTVTITATPSGDFPPFTLTWSDGFVQTGVTGPVSRTFVITEPTTFTVFVTDSNGCESGLAQLEILLGRESAIVAAIFEKYSSGFTC
ncbi:MAG TPA: hypothetical protein VLG50_04300, partial [Candidatus Saccharimonadales bacterium]|nr:hypothetical protein [Candidatus Saccharimonadales bacterium]